jgi:hypothetical protein
MPPMTSLPTAAAQELREAASFNRGFVAESAGIRLQGICHLANYLGSWPLLVISR